MGLHGERQTSGDLYAWIFTSRCRAVTGDALRKTCRYLLPYLVPGCRCSTSVAVWTTTADPPPGRAGSVTASSQPMTLLSPARAEAQLHRLSNISFTIDVHKLDFLTTRSDVVHAHQVLQHASPIRYGRR